MSCELPDVQAGIRKGRGTRNKIAYIHSLSKKGKSSGKTSISALLTIPKPLTVWITINCGNSERDGNTRPPDLPLAAATAKSLQSCPTLCDPIDGSPPGSPVPGILQARTLEGLPFPSPMSESGKWKWSHSVMSDSSRHPWDFPGKSTGVGCH